MSSIGAVEEVPRMHLEEEDDQDAPLVPRRATDEDVDMDITPMIDITFLMLIFFLVASTPDQQTAVDLPQASHGVAVSQLQSVVITIGDGGLNAAPVFLADGKIPGSQLSEDRDEQRQQIRAAVEEGTRENKTNVVIKADTTVAHRDVARVVKAVSQIPGIKIHLAVLETE